MSEVGQVKLKQKIGNGGKSNRGKANVGQLVLSHFKLVCKQLFFWHSIFLQLLLWTCELHFLQDTASLREKNYNDYYFYTSVSLSCFHRLRYRLNEYNDQIDITISGTVENEQKTQQWMKMRKRRQHNKDGEKEKIMKMIDEENQTKRRKGNMKRKSK